MELSEPSSEPRRAAERAAERATPSSDHVDRDHVDHVPSSSTELRPRRPRPRPEQLRRAPTTSATRPRRNDDRREERRYDNRDHSHGDRPKSSRTGQLHRDQPDVYPKIIFLNNAIRGNLASRGKRSTITVPGIHARGDVN